MSATIQDLTSLNPQLLKNEKDLKRWIEKRKVIQSIKKLPGDASSRQYFRVKTKENTFVLMRTDPFEKMGRRFPFVEIQNHLQSVSLPVPKIFDFNPKQGTILLEDLGDQTLLRHLATHPNRSEERKIYSKLVELVYEMQTRASPSPNHPRKSLAAFQMRFDLKKFMWEVQFTVDHFFDRYLNRKFKGNDRGAILKEFEKICLTLDREPPVFVHRDLHSRNLMVLPQKTVMIDFQDARLGPSQYDLASLLRDSYYQVDEDIVEGLLDSFAHWVKKDRRHESIARFKMVFDLMAIQRNFKAIGSFASFQNLKGNSGYLKYIGNTFENIRRTLKKHSKLHALHQLLCDYYYF